MHLDLACQESGLDSIIFIHISYIISVSPSISYLNLFISPEPQLSSKLLKLRPKSCEITLP
jgi:hypothetical protein